jgi:hypothetical protein
MSAVLRFARRHVSLLAALGFFIALILFLIIVPPSELLDTIGVRNSYILLFFLALLGGISVFTSGPFYAGVATFASQGSDIALLAVVGGAGIFLSDCAFYLLVRYGKASLKGRVMKEIESMLVQGADRVPKLVLLGGIYLYASMPLPSDVLMAVLALSRIPFVGFAPVLFAGNVTAIALVALFGGEYLASVW